MPFLFPPIVDGDPNINLPSPLPGVPPAIGSPPGPTPQPTVDNLDASVEIEIEGTIEDIGKVLVGLADALHTLLVDIKIALANMIVGILNGDIVSILEGLAIVIGTALAIILITPAILLAGIAVITGILSTVEAIATVIAETVGLVILIEISQTLSFVSDGWLKQLTKLYSALAQLAKDLSIDVGFMVFFAEVSRAELHGLNALVSNGHFNAEAQFADGMVAWLKDLKGNLNKYADDPSQIFFDIQQYLIKDQLSKMDDNQKLVLAEIAAATEWILGTGSSLIQQTKDLGSEMAALDPKIAEALNKRFGPLEDSFQKFQDRYGEKFYGEFQRIAGILQTDLNEQGVSISKILDLIKNPSDLFMMLANMGDASKQEKVAAAAGWINYNRIITIDSVKQKADKALRFSNPFLPYSIPDAVYDSPPSGDFSVSFPVIPASPPAPSDFLFVDDDGADVNSDLVTGE